MTIGVPILGRPRVVERSTEEWEQRVGEQLRQARIAAGLDQTQLAANADVSIGALRGLERGTGSSLKTVVRVVRALGLGNWLDTLSPTVGVSPIDILRTGRPARARVYRARGTSKDPGAGGA